MLNCGSARPDPSDPPRKCALALVQDVPLREGETYSVFIKQQYCEAGGVSFSDNRSLFNYWVAKLAATGQGETTEECDMLVRVVESPGGTRRFARKPPTVRRSSRLSQTFEPADSQSEAEADDKEEVEDQVREPPEEGSQAPIKSGGFDIVM